MAWFQTFRRLIYLCMHRHTAFVRNSLYKRQLPLKNTPLIFQILYMKASQKNFDIQLILKHTWLWIIPLKNLRRLLNTWNVSPLVLIARSWNCTPKKVKTLETTFQYHQWTRPKTFAPRPRAISTNQFKSKKPFIVSLHYENI